MSNEQKFVILISRLTFSDEEEKMLFELLKARLNWQEITGICIQNKVLGLMWFNMIKRNYHHAMPKQYRLVCKYFYECNRLHNLELLQQFNVVKKAFDTAGIKYVPLKGIEFLNSIYTDIGSRQLGDIDIFVEYSEYDAVKEIMHEIGYVEGEYEYVEKHIIPIDRRLELLHKTYMGSFHPFKKKASEESVTEVYSVDVSYQIQGDITGKLAKIFLNNGWQNKALYFVYLCNHLYKEAVNPYWIYNSKSDNLIKYCDIYEFLLQINDYAQFFSQLGEYIEGNKHLSDAVFYTIYYLNILYENDVIEDIFGKLKEKNFEIVEGYIDERTHTKQKWTSDFFERLFYERGKEQIKSKPKYMDFQINPSDKFIKVEE